MLLMETMIGTVMKKILQEEKTLKILFLNELSGL